MSPLPQPSLQPSLHRQHVAVAAPSQLWLSPEGRLAPDPAGLTGVFHADTRLLDRALVTVDGGEPQPVGVVVRGNRITVEGLARNIAGPTLDPAVRVVQVWTVEPGAVRHRIELSTSLPECACTLAVHVSSDFAPMDAVRVGRPGEPAEPTHDAGRLVWERNDQSAAITPATPGAQLVTSIDRDSDDTDGFPSGHPSLSWSATLRRGEPFHAEWSAALEDAGAIVRAAADAGAEEEGRPGAVGRLLAKSLNQLAGLRVATTRLPDAPFLAAGAPWYFTLFGRDSLWAARLLLPLDSALAAGTLHALAAYQGTERAVESAEEPGKIPHEIRARELVVDNGPGGDQLRLPPVYYGTVDATALWLCLLGELWRTGRAPDAVRRLLPAARRAADWLLNAGTGPLGFLAYRDESGHGLSNQGWKDSADAMQFLDGRRAEGPIALAEVQGYAHQAALEAAALFEELREPGGGKGLRGQASALRDFAGGLQERFREAYWVDDAAGRFPAMALDAAGTPLDSPGSNMGHLLGTGLLDADEARLVVDRLLGPELFSGFGIRTLSTEAAGYWPLSYHCGSVWAHDTAIAVRGMLAEGFRAEAASVARGLVRASESFGNGLPELFSGVGTGESELALAYPAACWPQAWSAASAVVLAQALAS
ncbi:glycogen debranching N-terminal domain-containing protein [Sinomonas notoginsengisoli]|uniref:glycogen debranching N-terminal domain-containing protein n=1 Tax=Sinomonas notoginsengisoli TaxID=1457311 RepID=UPI001F299E53|nr:glycogen debranching N-terminal domain-containing protein [Sinomonas notoginsengisoli]